MLVDFIRSRGAVVWPEIQAALTEGSWIHDEWDRHLPPKFHVDSHHLRPWLARLGPRAAVQETVMLQGHEVASWIDGEALLIRGRRTELRALAAAKRRTYRSLLGWSFRKQLCGEVGEHLVWNVLQDLKGTHVLVPRSARRGRVSSLEGRPITVGGPLDASGAWPTDPDSLRAPWIPFAVEVKNLRSILYPFEHDVWDLLAKLGEFPDVIPVLVARRIHFTTFRMFKDIGALGHDTRLQHFSTQIDSTDFRRTVDRLGITDAVQTDIDAISPSLRRFFADVGPRGIADRMTRWSRAAPIVARYSDVRREDLGPGRRRDLWRGFTREIMDAGLYETGGWGPRPRIEWDEEEDWEGDEDSGRDSDDTYWDEADWTDEPRE